MKVSIVESIGISEEIMGRLIKEKLGEDTQVAYYGDRTTDVETLAERAKDAEVVVLTNLPWKREVMERCPGLKMIAVAFTGFDHVDMDYCKEHGITVCNCAGYSNEAVSELVFGFAISQYRFLKECDQATRQGKTKAGLVGRELSGKKFGIIGTGAIGTQVAQVAAAFGCEVYAYSRTIKDGLNVRYVSLEQLMATCDIISVHVPSNASTKGLISKEMIGLMKKDAILINTARGPIVDSKALADALNGDRIAGACIDVFEMEPPIPGDHPLLTAKHVSVAPHIGFATTEALEKRAVIVFDNIAAYQKGTPRNVCK